MYYFLTEGIKRQVIAELRAFWSYHPKYRDIVEHIRGKFSSKERPSYGIVLKSSSANHVTLAADNFQGTVVSYVQLAKYQNKPGVAIEWVSEDSLAIQQNGGVFPSPAGVYYINVDEVSSVYDGMSQYGFYVDPLYEIQDEVATKVDDFTWSVDHSYLAGTTRVLEMPGYIPYVKNVNYTEDPTTGQLTIVNPLPPSRYLLVSYRYPGETTGPWPITENFANKNAIPGVVLAFGRRLEKDDIMAVVVGSTRQATALEYGGKWDISLDLDVIARDPYAQQEISDATIMFLWGVARSRLSSRGIEITQVSMGGESEDTYDANGNDYYYTANISIQVLTDWRIHVPLMATIRQALPLTRDQTALVASMTDQQVLDSGISSNLAVMESLGLSSLQDPYFAGDIATYETLK